MKKKLFYHFFLTESQNWYNEMIRVFLRYFERVSKKVHLILIFFQEVAGKFNSWVSNANFLMCMRRFSNWIVSVGRTRFCNSRTLLWDELRYFQVIWYLTGLLGGDQIGLPEGYSRMKALNQKWIHASFLMNCDYLWINILS